LKIKLDVDKKTPSDATAVHGRMQKFKPQGSSLNLRDIMPAKRQSQPKRPTRRLEEHWQPKLLLFYLNKQLTGKRELSNKRPLELLNKPK
jgi:hypothetical protein